MTDRSGNSYLDFEDEKKKFDKDIESLDNCTKLPNFYSQIMKRSIIE